MPDAVPPAATEILPDAVYTSTEVARIVLRCTVATFYNIRKRLVDEESFPRPISRIGQPKYRGADLLAWAKQRSEKREARSESGNVLYLRAQQLRKGSKA